MYIVREGTFTITLDNELIKCAQRHSRHCRMRAHNGNRQCSITLTTNDNMFSFLSATTCRCRVYVHVHVRSTMITDSTRKAAHGGVHVRTLKTSGSLGPIFWKHSVRGSGMLLVPGCTGPINELPPPPPAPGLGVGPGLSGSGMVLLLKGPGMGIVSGLVTDSTLSLMAFSASIASFSIRAAMS